MRTRQRLVRALITEIIADVDEAAGEIVLIIHWKGGQHSELRVRKLRTGEHGCNTPEQSLAVMRSSTWRALPSSRNFWNTIRITSCSRRSGSRPRPTRRSQV